MKNSWKWVPLAWIAISMPAWGISFGQVDDFSTTSTMDWVEGGPSPNPPTVVDDGAGPDGGYLVNVSAGGGGEGSRMVMMNDAQWAGNYLAAGVTRIDMQMANLGATEMHIRIAIEGAGSRFGSTNAFVLPADGIWRDVSFFLSVGSMSQIEGTATLDEVLAGVEQLRLLSASAGPSWRGDRIAATLAVDNIAAVPLPAAVWLLGGALLTLVGRRSGRLRPARSSAAG